MNQSTYLLCLPLLLGAAACPDRQGAASMNPAPRNIEQVDRGSPPGDPLRDTAALNQGDALRLKGHGVQLSAVPTMF